MTSVRAIKMRQLCIYIALAAALGVVVSLILALWLVKKCLTGGWRSGGREAADGVGGVTAEMGSRPNDSSAAGPRRRRPSSRRILSIDTFRGYVVYARVIIYTTIDAVCYICIY